MASRPSTSGRPTTTRRSKRPGPQQGRVEHIGPIGGGHQDHAFVGFEAVHLDEQLVERLLALIVSAAEARAAMAAHGVDFVDEDDAGRVLLALFEEIADAAGADAHEHLDKVRARNRKEGHRSLAGDGARQEGLAGAGRTDQQHALGNAAAQLLEFLRLAQELDDLLELFLGLFDARDVLERDLFLLRVRGARGSCRSSALCSRRFASGAPRRPKSRPAGGWAATHSAGRTASRSRWSLCIRT